MGGNFSIPSPPPPITIVRPRPGDGGAIDGLSISSSQGCKRCVLSVPQGVSSSSASIYREQGDISVAECSKLSQDIARVAAREMTIDEFKENARTMKYSSNLNNGYCAQLSFSSDVLARSDDVNEIIKPENARAFAIRRLTDAGGYSSGTKIFIRPSIPFHIKFNGEDITVSTMTLFHPAPIRVDNIQYDAVLTLGDIGSDSKVIMVPLAGSIRSSEPGRFISRIAPYIPGTLQPRPGTGLYPRIDVPTGNDWNLSMLFPGSPQGGETIVDSDYFVWYTAPPVEKYLKDTITSTVNVRGFLMNQTTYIYDWRPIGPVGKRIIMLNKPIQISSFDLQTIKMLPATPPDLPPPLMESLVYRAATKCTTAPTGRETFVADRCDPLANIPPPSTIDKDGVRAWILTIMGTALVFVGIYLAILAYPKAAPYVSWAADRVGNFLAGAGRGIERTAIAAKTGIDSRIAAAKQGMQERSRSRDRAEERRRQQRLRDLEDAEAERAQGRLDASLQTTKPPPKLTPEQLRQQERAAGTGLLDPEINKRREEEAEKSRIAGEEMERMLQKEQEEIDTGRYKPKPKRTTFEEELKPKAPAFDRSKMTAEQLKEEARAAGTGLFDPEINKRLEDEARESEAAGREMERLLQKEQAEIEAGRIKREEALKRVEDAKKKINDLKKDLRDNTKEIDAEKGKLLANGYTKQQIELMLAETNLAKAVDDAQKKSEDVDKWLENLEKEAQSLPAPAPETKPPTIPPHQRKPTGMPVREGTKKPSAETPVPKPGVPPTGPLQRRLDQQLKKGVSPYRPGLAFGSRQGRWSTKEQRDLEDAKLRARQSAEDIRRVGRGGRKRKNMSKV